MPQAHLLASGAMDIGSWLQLPDIPSFPEVPDALSAAIITGAFAFITQALVKVWEVRQKRRDELTQLYGARFAAVQNYSDSVTAAAKQRHAVVRTRQLLKQARFRDAEIGSEMAQRRAALEREVSGTEKTYPVYQNDIDVAAAEVASTFLPFRLYAKRPLLTADHQLRTEIDEVRASAKNVEPNPNVSYRWLRTARWELSAAGSIGPAFAIYWLFSLLVNAWWFVQLWASYILLAIVSVGLGVNKLQIFLLERKDRKEREEYSNQLPPLIESEERTSGAGHRGTDNQSESETQGGNNGSIDDDESGSSEGDRQ